MRKYYFSFFSVSMFVLLSCSQQLSEPPGGSYRESVSQLGALPVYPPREDFQVGDIYVVQKANGLKFEAKREYLATKNLSLQINDYLNTRYSFDSKKLTSKPKEKSNRVDTTWKNMQSIFRTLPIAAFPTITVRRGAGASFGSASVEKLTGKIIGGSASASLYMTLTFSGVRSYSLPAIKAIEQLNNWCVDQARSRSKENCSQSVADKVLNYTYGREIGKSNSFIDSNLLMASKVYLARKISYEYSNAALAALVAKEATADGEDNKDKVLDAVSKTSSDSNVGTININIADPSSNSENNTNSQLSAQLQSVIEAEFKKLSFESGTENTKGFSVSAINSEIVKFDVEFLRPVAIGYKAIQILALPDETNSLVGICFSKFTQQEEIESCMQTKNQS